VAVAIAAALASSGVDRHALIEEVIRFTPPGQTLTRLRRAAEIDLDADPASVGDHRAGESVAQLAADYNIPGDVIEGVFAVGPRCRKGRLTRSFTTSTQTLMAGSSSSGCAMEVCRASPIAITSRRCPGRSMEVGRPLLGGAAIVCHGSSERNGPGVPSFHCVPSQLIQRDAPGELLVVDGPTT